MGRNWLQPQIINILRSVWLISITFLGLSALILGLHLSSLYKQQNKSLETTKLAIKKNQSTIKEQEEEMHLLKSQLNEQKSHLSAQKEKYIHIQSLLSSIEKDIIALNKESDLVKDETKNWQKEYVTTLLTIEGKLDTTETKITVMDQMDQDLNNKINIMHAHLTKMNIAEIRNEIQSMRTILNKIINNLPALDPTTRSIQRQLHSDLLL